MIPKECRRLAEVDFPRQAGIDLSVTVSSDVAADLEAELRQILEALGLSDKVGIR